MLEYNIFVQIFQFNQDKNNSLLKLKISGVLRVKDNVETEILSAGLVYTSQLRHLYNENAKYSKVVVEAERRIQENINNGKSGDDIYNIELPWIYSIDISEMEMINVHSLMKINYGSTVIGVGNVGANGDINNAPINYIGFDSSYFINLIDTDSYVTIKYDKDSEIQDIDIYGSCSVNSLSISAAGAAIDSKDYYFPFSWRYDLSVNAVGNKEANIVINQNNKSV